MNESIRALVRLRASNRCEYCRMPNEIVPLLPFHIDHVIALQHGGSDDPNNLALACDRCNVIKGPNLSTFDPETRSLVRLFDPRTQTWREHFRQVGFRVEGLTSIGRATVQLLQMNARERVQLRQAHDLRLDAD